MWRTNAPAWNRSERPLPRPLTSEKLVPPPASAKSGQRIRREAVVDADRRAVDPAGHAVRSQHRVAVGGLRPAIARGPHAPALGEGIDHRRRLAIDRGVGVALALRARLVLRCVGADAVALVGKLRRAGAAGKPSPRPATNGSVSSPRNRFMASNVVCCDAGRPIRRKPGSGRPVSASRTPSECRRWC